MFHKEIKLRIFDNNEIAQTKESLTKTCFTTKSANQHNLENSIRGLFLFNDILFGITSTIKKGYNPTPLHNNNITITYVTIVFSYRP